MLEAKIYAMILWVASTIQLRLLYEVGDEYTIYFDKKQKSSTNDDNRKSDSRRAEICSLVRSQIVIMMISSFRLRVCVMGIPSYTSAMIESLAFAMSISDRKVDFKEIIRLKSSRPRAR